MTAFLQSFWLGFSHTVVVLRHVAADTDTAGAVGVAFGMALLFGVPASLLTWMLA